MQSRRLIFVYLIMLGGCFAAMTNEEDSDCATSPAPEQRTAKETPKVKNETNADTSDERREPPAENSNIEINSPSTPIRFLPVIDANRSLVLCAHVTDIYEAAVQNISDFQKPIPHTLHRVLAFDERKSSWQGYEAWHQYAQKMGYTLKEWLPSDLQSFKPTPSSAVAAALEAALQHQRHDVLYHLLGLHVLSEYGGIWIGPRTLPPKQADTPLNFDQLSNLEGLVIATNQRGRRVGGESIYLTTSWMAASKQHPWVSMVAQDAADNTLKLLNTGYDTLPARYFAGNTFLSKNLSGFYSVLPFSYLQSLGVFPAILEETENDSLD